MKNVIFNLLTVIILLATVGVGAVFGVDGAAMGLDDLTGDGQAQA